MSEHTPIYDISDDDILKVSTVEKERFRSQHIEIFHKIFGLIRHTKLDEELLLNVNYWLTLYEDLNFTKYDVKLFAANLFSEYCQRKISKGIITTQYEHILSTLKNKYKLSIEMEELFDSEFEEGFYYTFGSGYPLIRIIKVDLEKNYYAFHYCNGEGVDISPAVKSECNSQTFRCVKIPSSMFIKNKLNLL
jgi:hypothetical protein